MGDFTPDTSVRYNLIPLASDERQNIYIDTAWFIEPVQLLNQNARLIVRIKNSGDKAVEGNRLAGKLQMEVVGRARRAGQHAGRENGTDEKALPERQLSKPAAYQPTRPGRARGTKRGETANQIATASDNFRIRENRARVVLYGCGAL